MDIDLLITGFHELYGDPAAIPSLYFAPGRVNLIGEHTDYNGGYVLPCALDYGTYLVIRKIDEPLLKFASSNMPRYFEIPLAEAGMKKENEWVNYPLGVIDQLIKRGMKPGGMELYFSGDIPWGAGLSSSASIEVVTAFAFNDFYAGGYENIHLAKICQQAENEFVGMNCGIMDQFASALGKKKHGIFLNCATLNFTEVPVAFPEVSLVISNTNKKRELVGSKYNERRSECKEAVRLIAEHHSIGNLSQIAPLQLDKLQVYIKDETLRMRARHVVTENMRVLEAVKALHFRDAVKFGELMYASHASLRDDFEVSCRELDILVEEARKIEGTIGSRMTGGGFGGCTVSFVKTAFLETFTGSVGLNYKEKTGLTADFYVADIGGGVRKLR